MTSSHLSPDHGFFAGPRIHRLDWLADGAKNPGLKAVNSGFTKLPKAPEQSKE